MPVCVHRPSRVPGSVHDEPQRGQHLPRGRGRRRGRGVRWPVAQHQGHRDRDEDPDPGRGQERRRPARRVQQGGQGHRAEHLPELAGQAGELGHHRDPAGREPRDDHREHADERQRVPGPHEHPRHDRDRERVGQRQHGLTGGHQERPGHHDQPCTEPVRAASRRAPAGSRRRAVAGRRSWTAQRARRRSARRRRAPRRRRTCAA